jgi:dihydroxy-acid dehydratase
MVPANYAGERVGFVKGQEILFQEVEKLKGDPHLLEAHERKIEEITDCCGNSAGACGEMTTGNSLALLTEAMGFSLPGSSTSPGVSAEKIWQSKETG